jgi:small neutral amino acid transporter SnatA (MarC family)
MGPDLEGEPFIFPLAVPFIAGPSAIVTVLLLMARQPQRWPVWLAALLCAWVPTGIILLLSSFLAAIMGMKALQALERLMGMLLTIVAVEMFIEGVKRIGI